MQVPASIRRTHPAQDTEDRGKQEAELEIISYAREQQVKHRALVANLLSSLHTGTYPALCWAATSSEQMLYLAARFGVEFDFCYAHSRRCLIYSAAT